MTSCPNNCPGDAGLPAWAGDRVDLTGRAFVSVGLWHLFFIPLRVRRAFARVAARVAEEGLAIADDALWLHRCGLFRGRLYVQVAPADHPGLERLDGEYRSAVHRGPWKNVGRAIRGLDAKETFLWYLTCPECRPDGDHLTVVLGR